MSEVTVRQLSLRAAELMGRKYDRQFVTDLEGVIGFTSFPPDVKDWRSCVDKELQGMWGRLDRVVRLAIYITALKASDEANILRNDLAAAHKRGGTG